jgi:hypothetical protein
MTGSWSRRAVLRGLGASLALPALELHSPPARAHFGLPLRLVVVYVPNGVPMEAWTPLATGRGYDLPSVLQPLAPVQEQVSVLTGLQHAAAWADGGDLHAFGPGTLLTCRAPGASRPDLPGFAPGGPSMDQLLAVEEVEHTDIASLSVCSEAPGLCATPWCEGRSTLSWRGPGQRVAPFLSPRGAFDHLFAGSDPQTTARAQTLRRLYRTSVIDELEPQIASLQSRLGSSDAQTLDDYLSGLRDLERRIEASPPLGCGAVGVEEGPFDARLLVETMRDVIVLALRCDRTRVVTWQMALGGSERQYGFLGVDAPHRGVAEHGGDPTLRSQAETIARWEVAVYAELVAQLSAVREVDGSVLDNSMILLLSSQGDPGTAGPLPVLLAGRGGGALDPGRHLVFPAGTPLADLHLRLMEVIGLPLGSFGDDGTAPLQGL